MIAYQKRNTKTGVTPKKIGIQSVTIAHHRSHLTRDAGPRERDQRVAPPQRVYEMAQVDQKDIDALYVYDAFSTNTWTALERFGFCKAGEAHLFTQNGNIELGGQLPINTNGGLMSEGHFSGYNHFVEMTRQLRGECGERQVQGAEVAQWITPFGDSLLLTKR